jgi:uncharacterized repeat protein (TIGR03806 family)
VKQYGPIVCCALLALGACQSPPRNGLDVDDAWPEKLSDWNLLVLSGDRLTLNDGVMPYDLSSALFSDYAHKFRTISVPPGTQLHYGVDELKFPVGTLISKTFYYRRANVATNDGRIAVLKTLRSSQGESLNLRNMRLLETRLLVNTASGWVGLPYVWNAAQTDATLELAGESIPLDLVSGGKVESFEYSVPDANQCAGCHALNHRSQQLEPIGVKARHLNRQYRYSTASANQLQRWRDEGLLAMTEDVENVPRNAQWNVASEDLSSRARAYLDVNCSHCHSAKAAASTSALLLDAGQTDPVHLGVCKIPAAAGRGSGSGEFDIVPGAPERSILLQRMQSTEPDIAMPELGRALVHEEGVALIEAWIASLPGSCDSRQP